MLCHGLHFWPERAKGGQRVRKQTVLARTWQGLLDQIAVVYARYVDRHPIKRQLAAIFQLHASSAGVQCVHIGAQPLHAAALHQGLYRPVAVFSVVMSRHKAGHAAG